ncbi:MAG: F0F1 ATP synthase subunit B [Candidatus Omnitrophica bacterium]|nr:F0F1 ATP synthase subunit B [Candidatus Omnitrophota bacterium]
MENSSVTHAASNGGPNILMPETLMVILTWVTFFLVLWILQKFAWKPILQGLKNREDYIRKSLDDADKIKAELVKVEETKIQILNEAKEKANIIIEQSRKSGHELANQIEGQAKKNAEDIIENAYQEIESERQRVKNALKKESAQIAVSLAEKILKENMDNEKNKKLINEAIKGI